MAYELNEYTLGSGHLHVGEADLDKLPKTSAEWLTYLNDFCKREDNLLGRIKGGASVEYSTEKTEDQDDLGYVVLEEITKEKVTLKSGMMTWNGETLAMLCATARTKTDAFKRRKPIKRTHRTVIGAVKPRSQLNV